MKHTASYADLVRGAGLEQHGQHHQFVGRGQRLTVAVLQEDLQLALEELALNCEINGQLTLKVIEMTAPGQPVKHELVARGTDELVEFVGRFHEGLKVLAQRVRFNSQPMQVAA